jgi:hypothetical protein
MNHRVTYFYFAHVTVSGWEPIGKGIKGERGLRGERGERGSKDW